MEPETQEAPVIPQPTGDALLAELRQNTPEEPPDPLLPERVPLKLTLDQASLLYEKLYRVAVDPPRFKPEAIRKVTFTVPIALLDILDERLRQMPSTTPVTKSKYGRIKFLRQSLALQVLPHEAKYLLRMLGNKKRDDWRRENREREHFAPLEIVEIAESGEAEEDGPQGVRRSFFRPTHHENPEAQMRLAVLKKALEELPKKLKMRRKEVNALFTALIQADGNVSEAARELGQPQRKTARRIERTLRHLKSRDLSA